MMRGMLRFLPVVLAAGALAVAGCGSSNNNSSSSNTTGGAASGQTQPTKSQSAPVSSGAITVDMKNIQFSPTQVNAKVGQTIKWVNQDSVDHNVTATSGASFKSDNFGKGASFETKLTKPGTIKYVCTIHPGMDGTIVVTK